MRVTPKDSGLAFEVAFSLRQPWEISSFCISKGERRLEVAFSYTFGTAQLCPFCGRELRDIFFSAKKTWHHLTFFQFETVMTASIPIFRCINNKCAAGVERDAILNTLFLDILLMVSPYDSQYALGTLLTQHFR